MFPRKASSLIVLSLLATFAIAFAAPETSSPTHSGTNPPPFDNFRAPVSGSVLAYLRLAQNLPSTIPTAGSQIHFASSALADPTTVFNLDSSPLPQNEETISTSPIATGTVLGGYNDYRELLALANPAAQTGFSGFSVSNDGGTTVRTDGDLPRVLLPQTGSSTLSGGDPVMDVAGTGTFDYASLYYNFSTSKFSSCPKKAPCESAVVVFPTVQNSSLSSCLGVGCWRPPKIVVDTTFTYLPAGGVFNDKDWIAVDRTSHASGLYVTYTAFNLQSAATTINMVRCSLDLTVCSTPAVISGPDVNDQSSFVAVRSDGSVAVTYVSYDLAPFRIRGVQCSPGTGVAFTCAAPSTIASINVELFSLTTENFRVPTFPQMAVDYSSVHSGRLIVVWDECATHYVQWTILTILTCSQGFVRAAFTDANTMAGPWTTLNVTSNGFFPTVSIDPTKGTVNIAYYSTINDVPWAHRLDLLVSQYTSGALTGSGTVTRVTSTSDEPADDPFLGALFFGDYIQATANEGSLYLSYTANYAQKGIPPTFQQDNYLTIIPD